MGGHLGALVEQSMGTATDAYLFDGNTALMVDGDKVMVEIIFTPGIDGETAARGVSGFTEYICTGNLCAGYVPIQSLTGISESSEVLFLQPSYPPKTNAGAITSEGDPALNTDMVRKLYGASGTGLTIGVISDSFGCISGGYAADVTTGDLPGNVNVLGEAPGCRFGGGPATDEGRAMLQLIYDIAPKATLQFHAAGNSRPAMASAILALAAAGSDVIVDDITFFASPWFQDGPIAQAVETVVSMGIPYFSSAGNEGTNAWHTSGFRDSGLTFGDFPGPAHNFASALGTVDIVQDITLTAGVSYIMTFQWDQPFASNPGSTVGSASDLDFYLVDRNNGNAILASATASEVGMDPFAGLIFKVGDRAENGGTIPTEVGLVIVNFSGPNAGYIKWLLNAGKFASFQYPVLSSTLVAHHNAANGAAVGAAQFSKTPRFGSDPALLRDFSSTGGTPTFFNTLGTRLATAETRQQPRFVGPDGTLTTFFGGADKRFSGTSAAAPHVAAVALLLKELDSQLTPAQIYAALQSTADDMNDPRTPGATVGFDFATGFGYVDGLQAAKRVRPLYTTEFRYFLNITHTYADYIPSIPTSAEIGGLTRLTTIFFRRQIAAQHSVPYEQVNIEFKLLSVSLGYHHNSIQTVYETIVKFDLAAFLPTGAQVKASIEGADKADYLNNFVKLAEPDGSVFER